MLKPVGNFIAIDDVKTEEKLASGLYVPPSAQNKKGTAKVLAVGTGVDTPTGHRDLWVKVGDTIVYDKFSGVEITDGDTKVLLIRESDVYAVLS